MTIRGLSARVAMLLAVLLTFWVVVALGRAGTGGGFRAEVDPYSNRYLYPSAILIVLLG
jgi:hypothetical protein